MHYARDQCVESGNRTSYDICFPVNTNKSWLRYIGVGYDLLHGNPGGMARTTGGEDPGMRLDKRVFQVALPPLLISVLGRFHESDLPRNLSKLS